VLHRNEKRFRGGLVFEAHRFFYHSTLGSKVIKKEEEDDRISDLWAKSRLGGGENGRDRTGSITLPAEGVTL